MKRLALLTLTIFASSIVSLARPAPPASGCCLPNTPTTYECAEDRGLYLQAMDLAGFNMLFPGDVYFGLPRLEKGLRAARSSTEPVIPPILLRSIGWIESVITQATRAIPYGAIGPALISFDCGHGIMQVTSGMTTPLGENGYPSPQQLLVATNFAYNIARGAVILADKWNAAPENRPIAGIDTNGDPDLVENWYFAVWSYNGFTGPGANRSNHPLDPIYGGWPRVPYSCGAYNDGFGHNRGNYPYQELVWGCAAHPPVINGSPLWSPFELAYPDLNDPRFRGPLDLANFVYPYVNMDIPTPYYAHKDPTEKPQSKLRSKILGEPQLGLSRTEVQVLVDKSRTVAPQDVIISNLGTGILSWMAIPSAPWLQVSSMAGVAVGPDLDCSAGAPCDRAAKLTLTVNPSLLSKGTQTATVRIVSPASNETQTIRVTIASILKIGAPGVTKG